MSKMKCTKIQKRVCKSTVRAVSSEQQLQLGRVQQLQEHCRAAELQMQSDQAVYSQGWVRAGSAQLWELASCSWVTARLLRLTAPAPAPADSQQLAATVQPSLGSSLALVTVSPQHLLAPGSSLSLLLLCCCCCLCCCGVDTWTADLSLATTPAAALHTTAQSGGRGSSHQAISTNHISTYLVTQTYCP